MPPDADAFRLGVNYWPSETAMDWLPRYDAAVVRRDFARIVGAGMDTVRIFLRWEDLQPEPATVASAPLAAVVDTADAAAEAGLGLVVTLFTGHMSGVNWLPAWATGGRDGDERFPVVSGGVVAPGRTHLRNWYGDPGVVDAQARLAGAVASALGGHPALWAWDLGNESSNCTIPPDIAAADRWLDRMTSTLRAGAPGVPITIGTHMEDIENDRRLGPAEAARWVDFVCMHGYPIYADWAHGPDDVRLVPFLAEVTGWLAGGAPVLFAEFGQFTAGVDEPAGGVGLDEDRAAAYTGHTLDALWDRGAMGGLVWCYADYAAELHHRPPLDLAVHERTFGLWRADGTPKPAVAEISRRAGRRRRAPTEPGDWLDITAEELGADRRHHLARLYERYCDAWTGDDGP